MSTIDKQTAALLIADLTHANRLWQAKVERIETKLKDTLAAFGMILQEHGGVIAISKWTVANWKSEGKYIESYVDPISDGIVIRLLEKQT